MLVWDSFTRMARLILHISVVLGRVGANHFATHRRWLLEMRVLSIFFSYVQTGRVDLREISRAFSDIHQVS